MNAKSMIQVLGSLEELNILQNSENSCKIKAFQIDSTNYGLLLYSTDEYRISFFKLNLNVLFCDVIDNVKSLINSCGKELYELILLNVFCLSFDVIDVISTTENIWAIGHKTVLDLKPHTKSALEKFKSMNGDEFMDTDDVEEFNHEMFEINIDVSESKEISFHHGDIFIGCGFIGNGFVLCHKKRSIGRWQLQFVLLKKRTTLSADWTVNLFLDFPVSFNENINLCPSQDQSKICNPVIVFIYYNDPERLIFENLFGISCLPSNAVCLVGHPEGKLLWSLCEYKNKFHSSGKLQSLLDMKQSIVGIHFFNDREETKGSGYMLIVGSLGQMTLISSKNHSSFTRISGPHPFWIKTFHIKSSVTDSVATKNCLLHFSRNGILWITEVSKLIYSSDNFCSASSCTEISFAQQVIDISRNQGLTLLKTSSGNLYLTLCQKDESNISSSSLPLLMNECLTQSTSVQELLQKKVLQSRLFTAISTFASLKFSENILNEPITFSISEVNLQPQKYLLVINLQCFEKLCLDPELCCVTASVFTYIKNNNSFVSKTDAYNPDEPTLCLELTDTVVQPPFFSIFPLLVEIGLVLQLPNKWKAIDCFQTISKCLPFYLRIQTFMVHELHLFHSNTFCQPQSFKFHTPKTLQIVKELAMKRPISNILKVESNEDYTFPVKFNLCLSASSVEEMMKNTEDSDPCTFIKRLLFGNKQFDAPIKGPHQLSKSSPLSVTVGKNNSTIIITVHANSFESLTTLRITVMDILLSYRNQIRSISNSSTHVSIPASIYRRCEEISKSLMNLYGKDIESKEVTQSLLQLYQELRTDVSGKLPIL